MFNRRNFLGAAALALGLTGTAQAADFEFNLHGFLPAPALIPSQIIDPWADSIEAASDGAVKINRFPAMQLGGRPPELMDQAIDGIVDISWTVIGYTPGRFPSTEVFELPFMVSDAGAASSAYWRMMVEHMEDSEFKDVKVLGTWVHGPGVIHASKEVAAPSDLEGLKVRGPSRQINALLKELGATPVGMPVPAVPEALSKGVIDGTVIPWEVTGSLKTSELVKNHTEFEGDYFYTVTFALVMNRQSWDSLSPELQRVFDENSGEGFSVNAANVMVGGDAASRATAVEMGNNIVTVSDTSAWEAASAPLYDAWVAEMAERGIDGQALIDQAKELMAAHGS
ncbi:TRAP transporter substrate-binding protein [Pseudaestuariivita sp.]|uniref:TRAP transporter substrate-binding protein n=1 Tax=Pseudaestuariivita sp. TaxID=2211669 RepID=UPI004058E42B